MAGQALSKRPEQVILGGSVYFINWCVMKDINGLRDYRYKGFYDGDESMVLYVPVDICVNAQAASLIHEIVHAMNFTFQVGLGRDTRETEEVSTEMLTQALKCLFREENKPVRRWIEAAMRRDGL